jgi:glucose-6-phosphate isomerase
VNQGLAVYGNKGSTDQHAYVQQLRDGIHNFFVVFVEVLRDRAKQTQLPTDAPDPATFEVEPGVRSGDYLTGFYLGTRQALYEKGRESISVTIPDVTEHSVGMLIALFERAVGLYATLINVNAYHQPGVEAGKKAAAAVLTVQARVEQVLNSAQGALSAEEVAVAAQAADQVEVVFKILQHLAANERVTVQSQPDVCADRYVRRS